MSARPFQWRVRILSLFLIVSSCTSSLYAASVAASPGNYRTLVTALKPGDELHLAPGQYPRLFLNGLNGTPEGWIRIVGPAAGPPAVIVGAQGSNTVEILNCSYLSIENLRIDSRGIPGAFGISARGHEDNLTHHIRIEGNTLVGQNGSQQTDGISTKTPTWGWIIRGNTILNAGTGLYLGDSDGSQPFVEGLVENNLVKDSIGYDMQIKDQISIPQIPGMPLEPTVTIIRNNVFIKNDQPSPDGDRPNLLVGAFPASGPGSLNMYQIYGNFFYHNHREALFQGSGRFSLHDNVFVDGPYNYAAIVARSQNYPLRVAEIYNNTVYSFGKGIYFGSRALVDGSVVGNLVFGLTPISGMITTQAANITSDFEDASQYVSQPSTEFGKMDFYPKIGACNGTSIDLRSFATDIDYTLDFNGRPKSSSANGIVCRGAYAGYGNNPGWTLAAEKKPISTDMKAPLLIWAEPSELRIGRKTKLQLSGANFRPQDTLSIIGAGIVIDQATFKTSTLFEAVLIVSSDALVGSREISLVNASGDRTSMSLRISTGLPRKLGSKQ